MRLRRPVAMCLVMLLALFGLAACADDNGAPAPAPAGVTRESFVATRPPGATGRELTLSRVTVEPAAGLAPHTHPGTQMAHIDQGTLTYSVYHGQVTVTRSEGATETYGAGETIQLNTGDSLIEPRGMVHSAKNDGGEPVVILLTSLFDAGEPASRSASVE